MVEVNPMLGLQDQVHHPDAYDMVSGGLNDSVKRSLPPSSLPFLMDIGNLGTRRLSMEKKVNDLLQ